MYTALLVAKGTSTGSEGRVFTLLRRNKSTEESQMEAQASA